MANITVASGSDTVIADGDDVTLVGDNSQRAIRIRPLTDWANVGTVQAQAGFTVGPKPASGRQIVEYLLRSGSTAWLDDVAQVVSAGGGVTPAEMTAAISAAIAASEADQDLVDAAQDAADLLQSSQVDLDAAVARVATLENDGVTGPQLAAAVQARADAQTVVDDAQNAAFAAAQLLQDQEFDAEQLLQNQDRESVRRIAEAALAATALGVPSTVSAVVQDSFFAIAGETATLPRRSEVVSTVGGALTRDLNYGITDTEYVLYNKGPNNLRVTSTNGDLSSDGITQDFVDVDPGTHMSFRRIAGGYDLMPLSGSLVVIPDDTPPTVINITDIDFAELQAAATAVGSPTTDGNSVLWSLTGVDAGAFTIDDSTGVFRFTTSPDFENPGSAAGTNVYSITVVASDNNSAAEVQQPVTVTVTDNVADNGVVISFVDPGNPVDPVSGVVSLTTNMPGQGNWRFARYLLAGAAPTFDAVNNAWVGAIEEDITVPVPAGSSQNVDIPENGATGTRYGMAVAQNISGTASQVLTFEYDADNTAPSLAVTLTSGDGEATVVMDVGEVVDINWVATLDATVASRQQILAMTDGSDAAGIDSGEINPAAAGPQAAFTITGLANNTEHYVFATVIDARGNSRVVSAAVTPALPAGTGIEIIAAPTPLLRHFGQVTVTDSVSQGNGQFLAPAGNNRLLVLDMGGTTHTPELTSISPDLGGVAFQQAVAAFDGTFNTMSGMFYMLDANIPTSLETLNFTFGETIRSAGACITCYENVDQVNPIAATHAETPSGDPVEATLTTLNPNSVVHSSWASRSNGSAYLPIVFTGATKLLEDARGASLVSQGYSYAVASVPASTPGNVDQSFASAQAGANLPRILMAELRRAT